MTLRCATHADAPLLAVLNSQLIQDEQHGNPMTVPQLEERMRDWLRGEYEAAIFEEGGEVVAYALYRNEEASVYLRQFFVKRECRRRGIGRGAIRLLLEKMMPRCPRITLDVLVHNEVAHKFWRSVGFKDYAVTLELCRVAGRTGDKL